MNRNLKIAGGIIAILVVLYLIWYFANIVVYIIIAGVLSFMGRPLVKLLNKIEYRGFRMPNALSSLITLVTIMLVIISFFLIFVPIISRQANVISHIDFMYLGQQLEAPLRNLEETMLDYGILENDQSIESIISAELESIMNMTSAGSMVGNVVGFAGSAFIALFSVMFLTFFFLKDTHLLHNGILLFVPEKYEKQANAILEDTRHLLSRYFVGLSIELLSMMTLISIGLKIFGVESAILIGFLGGMMNIIPYLGPIIGAMIGVIIGVTSTLSMGMYSDMIPISLIIVSTFAVANLIDNFILQPLIYSTSVKAHPIEIFLVILAAGSLAGIPGMILAIPGYTVIRIIAKQFFTQSKLVKKLTENI